MSSTGLSNTKACASFVSSFPLVFRNDIKTPNTKTSEMFGR